MFTIRLEGEKMDKPKSKEQLRLELKELNIQIRAKMAEIKKIRAKKKEIKGSEIWKQRT